MRLLNFIFLVIINFLILISISYSDETACKRIEKIITSSEASSKYPFLISDEYAMVNNFGLMITIDEDIKEIIVSDINVNSNIDSKNLQSGYKLLKINGKSIDFEKFKEIYDFLIKNSSIQDQQYVFDLKNFILLGIYDLEGDILFEETFFSKNYETEWLENKEHLLNFHRSNDASNLEIGINLTFEKDDKTEINIDIVTSNNFVKPTVAATLDISNIEKIDSKNNLFTAGYFLELFRWDEYNLTPKMIEEFGKGNGDYYGAECVWNSKDDADLFGKITYLWTPEFDFVNRIGFDTDKLEKKIHVSYFFEDTEMNMQPYTEISYTERGVADFTTNFNVETFPFDKQKIKMEIANHDGTGWGTYSTYTKDWVLFDAKLLVDREFSSLGFYNDPKLNTKNYEQVSGWKIGAKSEYITDHLLWTDAAEESGITSVFGIEIEIERSTFYFVFKLFSPIILILLVCWAVFFTKSQELESRLTVTITCFLALVAYTFVIDDELPKLEYLTLMDRVILSSYIFAAVPTLISIFSSRVYYHSEIIAKRIDSYSLVIGPSLYVIINYIIFISLAGDNLNNTNYLLRQLTFN